MAKAHFLKTKSRTKVTIKSAKQQLSFDFPVGVSISVVTEEPPEEVVGGFKEEEVSDADT